MSRLLSRLLCGLSIALSATALHAAPVVTTTAPLLGFSFSEYVGDAALGLGGMGEQNAVHWVHESTGEYNGEQVDSWFVFFEPKLDRVRGWLRFDDSIAAVFDSRAELLASSGFESGDHDYSYGRWVGLEGRDSFAVRGRSLMIDWRGGVSGDHVRVLTRSPSTVTSLVNVETVTPPVPEPSTYALMAAGLMAVLFMARRRRND